jgi:hypothetical protein
LSRLTPPPPAWGNSRGIRGQTGNPPIVRLQKWGTSRLSLPTPCPLEAERKRAKWRDLLFAPTRPRLIRVQVKATTQMQSGVYRVNAHRRINGKAVPYKLSEIDFFAAYVIPEDSWFIFPLPHILGATAICLSPKRRRKPHPSTPYREAWHLLRQPDGLEFA